MADEFTAAPNLAMEAEWRSREQAFQIREEELRKRETALNAELEIRDCRIQELEAALARAAEAADPRAGGAASGCSKEFSNENMTRVHRHDRSAGS